MPENYVSSSTITKDNLITGSFPLVTRSIIIKTGQNVLRGTLMGKDGDGKYLKSLSAATDGSQNPHSILARDVDATSEDKIGEIYITGQFNQEKVVFGTGHTIASTLETLRALSIYLEPVSKE